MCKIITWERTPINLIYWIALKSKYGKPGLCLMDWADEVRTSSVAHVSPYKEAIEIIDKYWTGEKNGSILR